MRFLSDGPDIPYQLLQARDYGQVVFFCGAGISVPSGLPDFIPLTRGVFDSLHVSANCPLRETLKSLEEGSRNTRSEMLLDRIFDTLYNDYGKGQVNRIVTEKLKTSFDASPPKEHSIVARLSTNEEGKPQIVTTNFDLLFEHPGVTSDITVFEPPVCPDLLQDQGVSGIIYLHGRLRSEDSASHSYILGSADFSRAYIIDGWATKFLRHLFDKYTVVLLGYQANDPLIDYLLRGLSSVAEIDPLRHYAFARDDAKDVKEKWGPLQITPIVYSGSGSDHSRLWDSLEAWAISVDDPAAWRSDIIEMARRGPTALDEYEYDQVAYLLRSNDGAKAFDEANPALSTEWLRFFDSAYHLAQPRMIPETVDDHTSRKQSSLDDAPAKRSGNESMPGDSDSIISFGKASKYGSQSDDLISRSSASEHPTLALRHSDRASMGHDELSPRLFHIFRWISARSLEPIVAWWICRQHKLHPRLASMISACVGRAGNFERERKVWNLIFEGFGHNEDDNIFLSWPRLKRLVAQEGWTQRTLRSFQKCTEPFTKINHKIQHSHNGPPSEPWPEINLSDIADFQVEFSVDYVEPVHVPDEAVCEAFSIASGNLIRGLERLRWSEEAGQGQLLHLKLLTFYPDKCGTEWRYHSSVTEYVLQFSKLMSRAAQLDPKRVSTVISDWPSGDRTILNKLKLFIWNQHKAFSGHEVAANLMQMDEGAFWSCLDRREFLILLRDRWKDIPDHEKARLFDRLLKDRESNPKKETSVTYVRSNTEAVKRIRWLELQGCNFPDDVLRRTAEVQANLPEWRENWASCAAKAWGKGSGWHEIKTERDASLLDNVPLAQVAETASKNTGRSFNEYKDKRPFEGLVRERPGRALSALGCAARRGVYPPDLWETLVDHWPDDAPPRATRLICERLRRLPDGVITVIAHELGSWMRDKLPAIAIDHGPFALEMFDGLLNRLLKGDPKAIRSRVGEVSVVGRVIKRSRRTIEHALNSPVGDAVRGLMAILAGLKLSQGHEMPEEFAARLESLLLAPGEGSDHAVCLLAWNLPWLHYIAPDWVKDRMVPLFALDHSSSEPAWNGLLHARNFAEPDLFEAIKGPFLEFFNRKYQWDWSDDAYFKAHIWLAITTTSWQKGDPRYTSNEDAREAILQLSEDGLCDIINHLWRCGLKCDDGWTDLVVPFLDDLWPKLTDYHTERASVAFLSLLSDTGDAFPQVHKVVRDFLCQMPRLHSVDQFHDAKTQDEESIASKFPKEP